MKLHDLLSSHKGKNVTHTGSMYKLTEIGDDYFTLLHTSAPGVVLYVNIPFTAVERFALYSNKGIESITMHLVND
ncbi:MAG TPA: hypothetical protein VHN14_28960 [Kofleriaceae bacterium]|nr:hypothetical protein [Kofleriaceae bacterium]